MFFHSLSRFRLVPVALLIPLLWGCSSNKDQPIEIDPAFGAYISAFTSGTISGESNVRIRLANAVSEEVDTENPVDMDLFDFDPGIDGEAWWVDPRTIEFRPTERMTSDGTYTVTFALSDLVEVPEELEEFRFQFSVIRQSLSLEVLGMKTYVKTNLEWQKLEGVVNTSDVANEDEMAGTLSATQNGRKLKLWWQHDPDRKEHRFVVDSIHRVDDPGEIVLMWNGDPIGAEDDAGEEKVEIPALGDFKLMSTKVVQFPDQYVSLVFSDPLEEDQNLRGLITLENGGRCRLLIDENEIRVYPNERQTGETRVMINEGVKNILGYRYGEDNTVRVVFENIKPAVEMLGKGVILPSNDGLLMPFRAVNLRAVNVRIIQIFEDNVAQFLQVNQLDGQREMKRVGRMVYQEDVPLNGDGPVDYGLWNTFHLDLGKLITTQPGAVYRVELAFKKKHSTYPCDEAGDENDGLEEVDENWDSADDDEYSSWDYYEDYYYYDDYEYSERDNPCHNTYYYRNGKVARNVLASDLGLIAKRGKDRQMTFAVTDLKTAEPLSGVTLEILNFQQQVVATTTTDGNGMAKLEVKGKPYLLVAKQENQRGYLRLDDGSSLSVSKFDVGGEVVQKGLKGFIYGERGVWRPGDSIYLTFLLEDKEGLLPPTHPVSMELINSRGQSVQKMVRAGGKDGFFDFRTKTSPDAPTGSWTCKVKVGGATFSRFLRIETVKPNRLKINIDFGKERLSGAGESLDGTLAVKWLHGAIAKNLKADINVTLTPGRTNFGKYNDYHFDDPTKDFESEEITVFDGRLDSEGEANVTGRIRAGRSAPGMLNAHFVTRAYEEGGGYSIDRYTIPYSPFDSYVGIKTPKGDKARGMLLTDTDHKIELVTVNDQGERISGEVDVEVYKLRWRWWWQNQGDNLSGYATSSYTQRISSERITTSGGFGEAKLRIEYPEWGRYLIRAQDRNSGHSTAKIVFVDWPGWAGRGTRENPGGASMLTFGTDKKEYKVGEKISITVPTSGAGRLLVSAETGSKVINSWWVEAEEDATGFSFDVTEEMAPNVYVNVTLVQPHNLTKNDLPIRMYGVVPVKVEDPETHLRPELKMPKVLAPEEEVTLEVTEENDKDMTYTIAMVDEGLLDLTRFKTPDPWPHFYAREALGVKTWDMYDFVMGAYAGEVSGLLAVGGDAGINKGKDKDANRFKPMVKFLGPFHLEGGQSGIHSFKMPRYIGSVRTMVIAGYKGAYGATEKTTPVKKPVMVLATLPRVVGPTESVKLPVTVFAMDPKVKNVQIKVEANELFTIQGGSTKSVAFDREGSEVVDFDLEVKPRMGLGKVKVTATSGSEKATYEIDIMVRNPNPQVVESIGQVIEPGQKWSPSFTAPGMAGTNTLTLEVSSVPPLNLGRRLKYLVRYPHGCVEQTTSGAFPQLFLADLMKLDSKLAKRAKGNVNAAIDRLRLFQQSSGGMAYWPGEADVSEWGTNYAGHFLVEANQRGFNVPNSLLKNWRRYQKMAARNWRSNRPGTNYGRGDDLIQAYRLYTLALAGSAEMGAMNRLKEKSNLTIEAKWRLATAYQLAGHDEVADGLISGLSSEGRTYSTLSATYGSQTRDQAMILETLSLMAKRNQAKTMVDQVSAALSDKRWMSTQTTAYCLLAMSKYVGKTGTNNETKFSYNFQGKSGNETTTDVITQKEWSLDNATTGSMEITNNGNSILYAQLVMAGTPATGDETASENDLRMSVTYADLEGNPIDVSDLGQGTDFVAQVRITNPGLRGTYREMALSQVFPSGWEIRNTRMDGFENANLKDADKPEYQDIRDDRVYTYFSLKPYKTVTYRVLLHASYQGRFYLPPVYGEAMYDRTINARKPGKWVNVRRQGETIQ